MKTIRNYSITKPIYQFRIQLLIAFFAIIVTKSIVYAEATTSAEHQGSFKDETEKYSTEVANIITSLKEVQNFVPYGYISFLENARKESEKLEDESDLNQFIAYRNRERDKLIESLLDLEGKSETYSGDAIQRENDAFLNSLGEFSFPAFYLSESKKKLYFDYKYFEDDDKSESNFVEALINSNISWFQYHPQKPNSWYRTDGHSALEFNLRIEPVFPYNNGTGEFGAVFAPGILYNIFPDVEERENEAGRKIAYFKNTRYIHHLKRIGIKAGIGTNFSNNQSLLYGGGLQIREITFWQLYDEDENEWLFAVGVADVTEFLDDMSGIFPMLESTDLMDLFR